MSTSGDGSSIISELTELIVVANAGNSSFVVQTDSVPALYIDKDAKVGINTLEPSSQLEVASNDGSCLKLRYKGTDSVASLNMATNGDMNINTGSSANNIKSNASLDLVNHNGNTVGLKLAGNLVRATAEELNFTTVSPGTASASKALVVNSDRSVSGIESLSANTISGVIQTAEQPNITAIGTLTNLSVSNNVSADKLTGTLQTGAQPNITQVGTLNSLNVSNGVSASTLSGTIQTASQPLITSIGNLASVSIAGSAISSEAAFLAGAVAGTAANSKVLVLSSSGSIGGIQALSATDITGTLQTGAQPNITSVGTLSNLNVTNNVTAARLTGQLQTAAQPNITSIGPLATVSIGGSAIGSEAAFLSGVVAGIASNSKVLVLNNSGAIGGITALAATRLSGEIQTAAQPLITSIGNLNSVSISGNVISSESAFLSGAVAGTAVNSKVLVLSSTGAISGISSLSASNLIGTIQTNLQPFITSVGTLSGLSVSGSATFTSASDSSSSTTGALTVSGGVGVEKKLYVGEGIFGEIKTVAQPNITSVGALDSLEVVGDLNVSGKITIGGIEIGTGGGGGIVPPAYVLGITAGTAVGGKALVLNEFKTITGITSIISTRLTGEIQTAAQPKITSLGDLTSIRIAGSLISNEAEFLAGAVAGTAANSKAMVLSSSGSISGINSLSATNLTGQLQTGAQPNITSVGSLSSLTVAGSLIGNEAAFLSGAVAGTAANSKVMVLGSSGSISGITSLTATNLTGQLQTAAQPNITSVGTLTELTVGGSLNVTGDIMLNGASISGGSGGGGDSTYTTDIVPGTAAASKALVVDSSRNLTNINNISLTGSYLSNRTDFFYSGATNWVSRHDNARTWGDIAWSPLLRLFVAVESFSATANGSIMTSPDGTTWTPRNPPVRSGAKVIWVPELRYFVATSAVGGNMLTSTDGITWEAHVSPALGSNVLQTICWSPERALFVGSIGMNITTSTDGKTWTSLVFQTSLRESGNENIIGIADICWSPERALFVGVLTVASGRQYSELACSSPNGTTWTRRSTPYSNLWWTRVVWSPHLGLFVAMAAEWNGIGTYPQRRFMTSTNGTTWAASTFVDATSSPAWYGLCWAAELYLFVAVGVGSNGRQVLTSPNGIEWTARTNAQNNSWQSVCWAPEIGTLAAVAANGTNRVMTYTAPTTSNSSASRLVFNQTPRIDTLLNNVVVASIDSTRLTLSGAVTATQLTLGTTTVNNITLGYISGVTEGTATAQKALVLDSSRNITNMGNISSTGTISSTIGISSAGTISSTTSMTVSGIASGTVGFSTSGGITAGGSITASGAISTTLGNISTTNGTVSGALITSTGNISSSSPTGIISAPTLRAGGVDITATTAGYISSITVGTVAASKAVVPNGTLDISGFRNITATGEISTRTLIANGIPVDATIQSVSGVTPGIAFRSKALIVDSTTSISGLNNISSTGTVSLTRKQFSYSGSTAWVSRTAAARLWDGIDWSPQLRLFVAVSYGGSANGSIMTSPDGITWTPRNPPVIPGGKVIWVAELGYFVANVASGSGTALTSINGIDWVLHSTPGVTLGTICWAPERALFVATVGSSSISTSTDGKTWTAPVNQTSLVNGRSISLIDICWSSERGLFVVIFFSSTNDAATVGTSPDGITWTLRSAAYSNMWWNAVTWSPQLGLFVAVGEWSQTNTYPQRRIMTSTNGTTWVGSTFVESNSTGAWNDICWSAELSLFVVVGGTHPDGNQVLTSPNGTDWTRVAPSQNNIWRAVCWAPQIGTFASVNRDGANRVMTYTAPSTDAIYSTKIDSDSPLRVGTYINNQLVASVEQSKFIVNGDLTASSITVGSTPISASALGYLDGVTPGNAANSKALVLGSGGSISGITSLTATNLTGELQTAAQPKITSVGTLTGLTVGGSINVTGDILLNGQSISGGSGGSSGSSESIYTTGITPGTAAASKALVLDEYRNISGLNNITATGTVSLTGQGYTYNGSASWVSKHNDSREWADVAWSPLLRLFVAVSDGGAANGSIITSPDGNIWTPRNPPIATRWKVIWVAELGYFVALSANVGSILTSVDGINWVAHSNPGLSIRTICWSPEQSLFVGADGLEIYTSTDGKTWTSRGIQQSLSTDGVSDKAIKDICWSAERGLFVGVMYMPSSATTTKTVCTSVNGTTWILRDAAYNSASWESIVWSSELSLFVAVGIVNDAQGGFTGGIMTSSDGITWAGRTYASLLDDVWADVCWASELSLFVAVGTSYLNNRQVIISPNGIDWTIVPSAQNNPWVAVCWAPEIGILASVAFDGSNRVMIYTASATNNSYSTRLTSSAKLDSYINEQLVASIEDSKLTVHGNLTASSITSSKTVVEAGFVGQLSATEYYGIGAHQTGTTGVRIGLNNAAGVWTGTYPTVYSGSFNSVSDYRVKDDVVPLPYGLAELNKLKPVKYKINEEAQIGFIAHEVQEIIPEVVSGDKDKVDENGDAVHQSVAYAHLTPLLIKAVQEQSEMIAQLRRELDELKK